MFDESFLNMHAKIINKKKWQTKNNYIKKEKCKCIFKWKNTQKKLKNSIDDPDPVAWKKKTWRKISKK